LAFGKKWFKHKKSTNSNMYSLKITVIVFRKSKNGKPTPPLVTIDIKDASKKRS